MTWPLLNRVIYLEQFFTLKYDRQRESLKSLKTMLKKKRKGL